MLPNKNVTPISDIKHNLITGFWILNHLQWARRESNPHEIALLSF